MQLYNSLTQKKELFIPLIKNQVKIYVCGITPYDTTHLGHAFTYVFFDTLIRYLKFKNYKITYVQNVTDIDDDILRKAKEEKKDWRELGNYWTEKFLSEMDKLNVLRPTNFVKATDSISLMIRIIRVLIEKGFAYEKNGNIYFENKKFKNYGQFSHFTREQMIFISKERGADPSDPNKKDPLDFILWQKAKSNEPSWPFDFSSTFLTTGAQSKDSGRPGWHIECSAMINQYLGDQIDIHGGGRDLIFPHHESEIAQSESYSGKKPFSRFFMHTAMVMHQGEKMSKSLGNLVMISDLLKKYSANAIRYILLSHHYRAPWEFEEKELKYAEKLFREILIKFLKKKNKKTSLNKNVLNIFEKIMNDDLNTSKVLQIFPQLLKSEDIDTLFFVMKILGFQL